MNLKEANEVKSLASDCYDAIKAIVGERKCPKCEGKGKTQHDEATASTGKPTTFTCGQCGGTGKVGWKWTPEVGEFYLDANGDVWCIADEEIVNYLVLYPKGNIPILPWERIEEILEGVGYELYIYESEGSCKADNTYDVFVNGNFYGNAKSRQEAVMLAVDKLRKEIEK